MEFVAITVGLALLAGFGFYLYLAHRLHRAFLYI